MLTLVYGPNGEDVNDFNYQEWIDGVISMDWVNEDITIRVSSRLPVLLVQIAVAEEKILHKFVQFGVKEDMDAGWKPNKFDRYGSIEGGIWCFRGRETVYELSRKLLQLEQERTAREAKLDPRQEDLF